MSVAEATRLLGVGRARVYQLLDAGVLDAVSEQPLRISIASVERRLQAAAPTAWPRMPCHRTGSAARNTPGGGRRAPATRLRPELRGGHRTLPEKAGAQVLSQAAREVLTIVAYEQPITRSDVSDIRGTDSSAVVETLMARKLIAEDPRFGARGRPAFLVTKPAFLQLFGLSSLSELPPRPTPEPLTISRPEAPSTDGSTECA